MRRKHLMPTLRRPHGYTVLALLSPKAIREKIAELTDRVQAIVDTATGENRDLTTEERTEVDGILGVGKAGETGHKPGKLDALEADLERAEKLEARQAQLAAARAGGDGTRLLQRSDGPGSGSPAAAELPLSARIRIPLASQYRYGRLRAFTGPRADERAFIAGQFWAATLFRNKRSMEWLQQHGLAVQAALEESSDSVGGFLVPVEVEQAIIDLREEYGVFRREARVMPMARDTKQQPVRNSGLTAYFVDEGAEITASDKAWTQVNLTARKLAALCKYSNELAEDAIISIGDDLTREIAYAFAVKEDACGFLGDGTSTYGHMTGIVNALAAGSVYTAITGNTAFSTLDLADFEAMVGKLPMYPGIRPKWFISQAGWAASMMRLADAAGGNTMAMLAEGPTRMFLGYPVVISQSMNSTLTAQTSTPGLVHFGDLQMGAILGSRRGMTIAISSDRYFEYDQIGIRGVSRFDINIHSRGTSSVPGCILSLTTPGS